jgi:hypothetical protein
MCEYMSRPGTGSSALSTVPVRDSVMKSVFRVSPRPREGASTTRTRYLGDVDRKAGC